MKKSTLIITIVAIAVLFFAAGMMVNNAVNSAGLSYVPASHTQCINFKCAIVAGPGPSICTTNANCGAQTHPTPTYMRCVNQKCVVTKGIGISQCQADINCVPKK